MVDWSIRVPENAWRKSSHSAEGGDCVEIAVTDAFLLVRDSLDRAGGILALDGPEGRSLLTRIRGGEPAGRRSA
ncbi:DUF397 domain-containing protein [Actinomadura hibisca]|uniref:DUF397 domain-containing protein n=1 Tax=Actinomadura hibisca TaxID=68565 RepID=UPI00082AADE3|nr:DUF397 domain-containing protein [Actinomadura hibisca]